MAVAQDPSVQRRRLRTELRKARDAAGLKQADVAKAMDWSPSKIIRIESGAVSISTNDLRALLDLYKVKERGRVTSLLETARSARAGSFYDQFSDIIKPGFRDYLAFEASASVIRQWEPILVPGLLQTEEYARAVLRDTFGVDDGTATRLWALREHRQEVHDRENPPEARFVIDEAALRRQFGPGGKIMVRQIERLLEWAALDHVTIQVLTFSAGANPGMAGSFILLEFSEPDLDDLVHLESVDEVTIKDDPDRIGTYTDRFKRLEEEFALSPEDSVSFLEKLLGGQPSAEEATATKGVAG
ncbi:MAG TPA: helix-turn-helix transcriptional regulator [Mycobacteriales bacterium]